MFKIKRKFDKQWTDLVDSAPVTVAQRLVACSNINERDDYHPEENTLVHIRIVFDRLAPLNHINLQLAAILHDICKPDSVEMNPRTGDIMTPRHDFLSARLMDNDSDIQDWIKLHNGDFDIIHCIVKQHIRVKGVDKMRKFKQDALRGLVINDFPIWNTLQVFTMADTMIVDFDLTKAKKLLSKKLKEAKRDIRLYEYSGAGSINKTSSNNKGHKFKNVDDAKDFIAAKNDRLFRRQTQYLIIEYTGKYESKIIEVL